MVIWSFALSVLGLTCMWLAGSGKRIGWGLAVLGQVAWIAFAIVFEAYGFIFSGLAYAIVHARNWWRWRDRVEVEVESA